jgi:hypothetical protein
MEAQSENSRQRRRFLPRLAVAVLAGAVLYWMAADAPLPFIAAWWRAGEQYWSNPLHRLADWLVLSDRLIGHSREDAESGVFAQLCRFTAARRPIQLEPKALAATTARLSRIFANVFAEAGSGDLHFHSGV